MTACIVSNTEISRSNFLELAGHNLPAGHGLRTSAIEHVVMQLKTGFSVNLESCCMVEICVRVCVYVWAGVSVSLLRENFDMLCVSSACRIVATAWSVASATKTYSHMLQTTAGTATFPIRKITFTTAKVTHLYLFEYCANYCKIIMRFGHRYCHSLEKWTTFIILECDRDVSLELLFIKFAFCFNCELVVFLSCVLISTYLCCRPVLRSKAE